MTDAEIREIDARWKSDADMKLDQLVRDSALLRVMSRQVNSMDSRLQTVERLVWGAVGGVAVLGAIAVIAIAMLLNLSGRVDSISLTQAAGIAERHAHEAAFKAKDAEMQAQIDKLRDGRR